MSSPNGSETLGPEEGLLSLGQSPSLSHRSRSALRTPTATPAAHWSTSGELLRHPAPSRCPLAWSPPYDKHGRWDSGPPTTAANLADLPLSFEFPDCQSGDQKALDYPLYFAVLLAQATRST
ncbi:hypothetical protein ACSSS7_006698 [Eimeria intestinalis]